MTDTQREAFEAAYAKQWSTVVGNEKTGADVAKLRTDDVGEPYGDRAYLNGCWWGYQAAQAADAGRELPPLPPPYEIEWPELHSQALGCGVEDRNIRDRYEAAEYGWQDGVDKAVERVPEEIFTAEQMREYARAALARAKEQK